MTIRSTQQKSTMYLPIGYCRRNLYPTKRRLRNNCQNLRSCGVPNFRNVRANVVSACGILSVTPLTPNPSPCRERVVRVGYSSAITCLSLEGEARRGVRGVPNRPRPLTPNPSPCRERVVRIVSIHPIPPLPGGRGPPRGEGGIIGSPLDQPRGGRPANWRARAPRKRPPGR